MQQHLPSKSSIIVVWALLIVYLTYLFLYKPTEDFFQLNYDWDARTVIENLGEVTVDSISHDYLAIRNDVEKAANINLQNTFLIEQGGKNYFRTSNITISDNQIIFSGVKWINGMPKRQIRTANFQIIDLPVIQNGSKTITTIGDSQMLWDFGREFRKNLHLKNNDLVFLGNFKDVYGYPHEAGIYMTTRDILESLPSISSTSNYVLFFGAQDKNSNMETLHKEVCEIIATLNKREQTNKIIILNLPPSPISVFNNFNLEFNEILNRCIESFENVKIISLYDELQTRENYLTEDGVHLNANGLRIAVNLLHKALK